MHESQEHFGHVTIVDFTGKGMKRKTPSLIHRIQLRVALIIITIIVVILGLPRKEEVLSSKLTDSNLRIPHSVPHLVGPPKVMKMRTIQEFLLATVGNQHCRKFIYTSMLYIYRLTLRSGANAIICIFTVEP